MACPPSGEISADRRNLPSPKRAIVTTISDVLTYPLYAADGRQSRAFGDGLEFFYSSRIGSHGRPVTGLLSAKRKSPLYVARRRGSEFHGGTSRFSREGL